MTLAIVAVVVLLLVAFAAAAGFFDRTRTARRHVVVDRPVARERVVEPALPQERVVYRERTTEL